MLMTAGYRFTLEQLEKELISVKQACVCGGGGGGWQAETLILIWSVPPKKKQLNTGPRLLTWLRTSHNVGRGCKDSKEHIACIPFPSKFLHVIYAAMILEYVN